MKTNQTLPLSQGLWHPHFFSTFSKHMPLNTKTKHTPHKPNTSMKRECKLSTSWESPHRKKKRAGKCAKAFMFRSICHYKQGDLITKWPLLSQSAWVSVVPRILYGLRFSLFTEFYDPSFLGGGGGWPIHRSTPSETIGVERMAPNLLFFFWRLHQ